MSEVLFLAHRIPYPPNKGDKIRSWRLLNALAARHRVHLGAFVDSEADWQYVPNVQERCASSHFAWLPPRGSRIRGALHALGGSSITEGAYRDRGMRGWVRQTLRSRPISMVFAFSSGVAQYAELPGERYGRRVIDLCDVDSDKWRQYAQRTARPLRWVYSMEERRLRASERRWVREFDATIVISTAERELVPGLAEHPGKVAAIANGVDTVYFDPAAGYAPVLDPSAPAIVFTGAMDYFANVDGVEWFATEVLPRVQEKFPKAVFVIVGSNPTPRVRALAERPGVQVTGSVPDVRPYLAQAACVTVCLRIARGVQNKLLEGMAMARPLVSTRMATAGVADRGSLPGVAVEDDPVRFADAVIARLSLAAPAHNAAARAYVLEHFSWDHHLGQFVALVEGRAA